MSVLVIVDHNNTEMLPSTRHLVTAALKWEKNPILLVVGENCESIAHEAAKIAGVHEVWCASNVCYAYQLPEQVAPLVVEVAREFDVVLASASTQGKNLLPRVGAMLDVAQVSDVCKILSKDTFERPVYAGNAIETVQVLDDKKLLTLRTTAFDAALDVQTPCSIRMLEQVVEQKKNRCVQQELTHSERPDLNKATKVVSGGRGLQSAEQFKLVEELADCLGAAVGASRAAVDAGFVPNDYQVGQTGKVVAPALYIAIGISGAVQHLAGMKDSKVVVAINKDEEAPIFQVANYGLVGDLFVLVPQLIEALKRGQ